MKKIHRILVFSVVLAGAILAGCAGKTDNSVFDPGQSGIFVTEEGTFTSATVEPYESKDYYSEEEWKAFLEKAVSDFNGTHGEGAVSLNSCSLKDGTARMMFDYASGDALAQFTKEYEDTVNGVDAITVATVTGLLDQMRTEGVSLVKASDGKAVSIDEVAKNGDYHVVAVESQNPVRIQTEGKIVYATEQMNFVSSYKVEPPAGKNYIIFK